MREGEIYGAGVEKIEAANAREFFRAPQTGQRPTFNQSRQIDNAVSKLFICISGTYVL